MASSTNEAITQPDPFDSLESMRDEHSRLLKLRRRTSFADLAERIDRFLRKGEATGRRLEIDSDRFTAQTLLDYWAAAVFRETKQASYTTLDSFDPSFDAPLSSDQCPYHDSRAYGDEQLFGYRRLLQESLARLRQTPLLAVVGAAGSGRSSFVHRALLPALKEGALEGSEAWTYPPTIQPDDRPLQNLAALFFAQDEEEPIARWAEAMRQDVTQLTQLAAEHAQGRTVLVIDHFEEIFTLCTESERHLFERNLAHFVEAEAGNIVILILQSDCLSRVDESVLCDLIDEGRIFLAFDAGELRQAIEEPARRVGLKFDEGLVDRILLDVQGDPAALTLLHFTLLKLWDERQGSRITWDAYNKVGGGRLALERSAEHAFKGLSAEDQKTARGVFLRLVRPHYMYQFTTARVAQDQLYEQTASRDSVDRVLDEFRSEGLLRQAEDDSGQLYVEIAHLALITRWTRLLEWLQEEQLEMRRRLRLTEVTEMWGRNQDPNLLWRGSLLAEAVRYQDLTPPEKAFVRASQRAEGEERRKLKRRIFWLLGCLAVVMLLATVAIYQRSRASREASLARQRLARQYLGKGMDRVSPSVDAGDPLEALLWLHKAYAEDMQALPSADSRLTVHRSRIDALMNQAPRLARVLQQEDSVTRAALSRDSSRLLTVSNPPDQSPDELRIWNLETGKNLIGQSGSLSAGGDVLDAMFDPDSNGVIFTITGDGNVQRHQISGTSSEMASDGPKISSSRSEVSSGEPANSPEEEDVLATAAFDSAGKRLITVDARGVVVIRRWDSQQTSSIDSLPAEVDLTEDLQRRGQEVTQVAFSADGSMVAAATRAADKEKTQFAAYVWSIIKDEKVIKNAGASSRVELIAGPVVHSTEIRCIAFSPDVQAEFVATGCDDGKARVWRVKSFKVDQEPGDVKRPVEAQWDVDSATVAQFEHRNRINYLAFSPDGRHLLTASRDRTARLWDLLTREPVLSPLKHRGQIPFAAFSSAGNLLVTVAGAQMGDRGGEARVWDLLSADPRVAFLPHEDDVTFAALSRDGRLVATTSRDKTARIWTTSTGQLRHVLGRQGDAGHAATVTFAAFNQKGSRLLTVSEDQTARLWDVDTGKQLFVLDHGGHVAHAAMTPDDQFVITVGGSSVRLWDAADGRLLDTDSGLDKLVQFTFAAFHPHQNQLLVAGGWPAETDRQGNRAWAQLYSFGRKGLSEQFALKGPSQADSESAASEYSAHSEPVTWAAFSSDGSVLATASRDDTVLLWRTNDGRKIETKEPIRHTMDIVHVEFDRSGKRLVTSSVDGAARTWDVQTGRALSRELTHARAVLLAAFDPSGRFIVTGSEDGSARVWDAETGDPVGEPLTVNLQHDGAIASAIFNEADGTLITASGGQWGQAKIWNLRDNANSRADVGFETFNRMAEFLADHKIDEQESVVPLTGEELERALKRHWPYYQLQFPPDLSGDAVRQWHRMRIAECRSKADALLRQLRGRGARVLPVVEERIVQERRALIWHLDQMIQLQPNSSDYQEQKAEAQKALANDYFVRGYTKHKEGLLQEALQDYRESIRRAPENGSLRYHRGRLFGQLGDWAAAAADFDQAVQLSGSNQEQDNNGYAFYFLALSRLAMNDQQGYRSACQEMLDHFRSTTTPAIANLTAWTCTLRPEAVADLDEPVRLARRAVGGQPADAHYYYNTLAATLHRRGDNQEALEWLRKSVQAKAGEEGEYNLEYASGWDTVLLAMVYHGQGETDKARECLEITKNWYRERTVATDRPSPGDTEKLYWAHQLELRVLIDEAENLLGMKGSL